MYFIIRPTKCQELFKNFFEVFFVHCGIP